MVTMMVTLGPMEITGPRPPQGVPRAIFPQTRCRGQFFPQSFPLRKLYFYAENILRLRKIPKKKNRGKSTAENLNNNHKIFRNIVLKRVNSI